MDPPHFDALTRVLGAHHARRSLLRLVGGFGFGAPLGPLTLVQPATARCKKRCGPCKRCRNGKCKRKSDGTACTGGGGATTCCGGKCVNLSGDPNNCVSCGTVCGQGAGCIGGGCQCTISGTFCTGATKACCGTVGSEEEICAETSCPAGRHYEPGICGCCVEFMQFCQQGDTCCLGPEGQQAACSFVLDTSCTADGTPTHRCCVPNGTACTSNCECCSGTCNGSGKCEVQFPGP